MIDQRKNDSDTEREIPEDVIREARANPNGYVYKITGGYDIVDNATVPIEVIAGYWEVDANGNLAGEFIPNPKYQPDFPKKS